MRGATQIILPPIHDSKSNRAAYKSILDDLLKEVRKVSKGARNRVDFERLVEVSGLLSNKADEAVRKVLALDANRHTNTFIKNARRTLGVDLKSIVRKEDLQDYLEKAALRNSGLIRNLSEDQVSRIQQAVLRHTIDGGSVSKLEEQLIRDIKITNNRAKLIATDQMSKLNSDLNRIRHEQSGITEYVWMTSRDERVRSRHRALDGNTYKYGEQTGAEQGLEPGQPVRCRCVGRGVVRF